MTKSLKTCVVSTSAKDTEAAAGSTIPDDRSENSQERFTGKSARENQEGSCPQWCWDLRVRSKKHDAVSSPEGIQASLPTQAAPHPHSHPGEGRWSDNEINRTKTTKTKEREGAGTGKGRRAQEMSGRHTFPEYYM